MNAVDDSGGIMATASPDAHFLVVNGWIPIYDPWIAALGFAAPRVLAIVTGSGLIRKFDVETSRFLSEWALPNFESRGDEKPRTLSHVMFAKSRAQPRLGASRPSQDCPAEC